MNSILYEVIHFDIDFLCSLIVNILNNNENEKFKFVKIDKVFIKDDKYVRYYVITNSNHNFNFSRYNYFKDFFNDMRTKGETYIISFGELDISSYLISIDKIDDFKTVVELLKNDLHYFEYQTKHWRFPGTLDIHYYDKFGGLFNNHEYLKDIFETFFEYRRKTVSLSGLFKIVDYAQAHCNEKYEILHQTIDGRWLIKDIECYKKALDRIIQSQYELYDIYEKEYKGKCIKK